MNHLPASTTRVLGFRMQLASIAFAALTAIAARAAEAPTTNSLVIPAATRAGSTNVSHASLGMTSRFVFALHEAVRSRMRAQSLSR